MSADATELSLNASLDLPYAQAVARVREALKQEGFGILTEIDVRETLKQKLDADFKRYVILGACNPPLAHRALSAEDQVGLLLPCNVIVYEAEAGTAVQALNPLAMGQFFTAPEVQAVAQEAYGRLQRSLASLAGEGD
ncbi:MAG: DUF302 domain-containing protein [Armatimonadota bacterium]